MRKKRPGCPILKKINCEKVLLILVPVGVAFFLRLDSTEAEEGQN